MILYRDIYHAATSSLLSRAFPLLPLFQLFSSFCFLRHAVLAMREKMSRDRWEKMHRVKNEICTGANITEEEL